MSALDTPPQLPTRQEEQAELQNLLETQEFRRSGNLARFLRYICEEYWAGRADQICEFGIATQALGRRGDFDPAMDSVVRVTARAIRHRLQLYYRNNGADRHIQVELPMGQYSPRFVRRAHAASNLPLTEQHGDSGNNGYSAISTLPAAGNLEIESLRNAMEPPRPPGKRLLFLTLGMVVASALCVSGGIWLYHLGLRRGLRKTSLDGAVSAVSPHPFGAEQVLAPPGPEADYTAADGPPFKDSAGRLWRSGICSGGAAYDQPRLTIQGTNFQQVFQRGRKGIFQCSIPASKTGVSEIHLLFAETEDVGETQARFHFTVNGWLQQHMDVADETMGPYTATELVYTDVHPESDGDIHLDFIDPQSFLSGVEVFPGIPGHMRPIRYVAAPEGYRDRLGRYWMPDEFVTGGSLTQRSFPVAGAPDPGLFRWERFGHFRYDIPVPDDPNHTSRHYTLRLFFSEGWFGKQRWVSGGIGSRVFDVYCNGHVLLHNFDILKHTTPGHEAVIEEFHHLSPSPQDRLEITFEPHINYAELNALEIEPERGDSGP